MLIHTLCTRWGCPHLGIRVRRFWFPVQEGFRVALALSAVWASVVWVFIRGLGHVAKPVPPVIFGVAPFLPCVLGPRWVSCNLAGLPGAPLASWVVVLVTSRNFAKPTRGLLRGPSGTPGESRGFGVSHGPDRLSVSSLCLATPVGPG